MKVVAAVFALIILAGCTPSTPPIVVDAVPVARPVLHVSKVDGFTPRSVNWVVVTDKNVTEIMANLKKSGKPTVLFALTPKGYESLAINSKETLRVILQQQAAINGYKRYYIATK